MTSSDLLPVSICRQIDRAYDVDKELPPVGDPGFIAAFEERLALATSNQPLIIFIDALDQIKGNIRWLPKALPSHVHLVVSTAPGSIKEKLDGQLPNSAFLKLKPLPDKDANDLLDRWLKKTPRELSARNNAR